MTHIETARVNEVIGVQIGVVQELAHKLTPESDLEGIEEDIAELEKALTYLKGIIEALPHRH